MWLWWDRLAQDLRYGFGASGGRRSSPPRRCCPSLSGLEPTPPSSAFSILSCCGPLPVRDPATLFQVLHRGDAGAFESSTYALYEHLKAQSKTIAGVFQVDPTSTMRVLVAGEADLVVGQEVTGDYFTVLGIKPVIGNVIEPRDERASTPNHVVVLGYAYWVRRFGRDPGVLGRAMTIDDLPYTIIGVTPPEFFGLQVGRRVDVSIPIDGSEEPAYWKSRALMVRLAPGVSREAAVADLNVAFQQYLSSHRTLSDAARAQAFKSLDLAHSSSGLSEFRDRYGKPVQAMLAIVFVLLVLGCANLASLFLARAATRQRDLSVCLALGASRTTLARQVLSETLLISMAGGLLGVLAASWGVNVLVAFLPEFGAPIDLQIHPDRNVLLFSLIATMLTGFGIGVTPAWLARRVDIRNTLSAGGRTVGLGGAAFKALIVVQVALSTVLVVAATLFAVTLSNLKTQPLGFVADGVLTLTVDADGTNVEGARLSEVHRQILQKLQSLPEYNTRHSRPFHR